MVNQPPRPTTTDIVQAGSNPSAPTDPYSAIASQLANQLSLSEGLQQQREQAYGATKGYVQGAGSDAVQTLVNPTNRAFGQSPVAGLSAGVNLNNAFGSTLDKSLDEQSAGQNNILQTLTALLNVKKTKDDSDRSDAELKLKQDAANDDLSVDKLLATRKALLDAGLDTGVVDGELQNKGVDTKQTTTSKATQDIADLADKVLAEDTNPISGTVRLGGVIGGGKGQKVSALYDQLKAKLSLDNVKYLKGQGAVSDAERQLLENASSAINNKMGDADFRAAITDLRNNLRGEDNGGLPASIRLKSPDGFTYDVPQTEVKNALDNGYQRI